MSVGGNGFYEFGPFRLDTGQRVLHRDGQLVSVPPKALETLFALIEGEGKVIGKEELLRKVWPETFVEEGNLTQNISILRKALGEGTNGQQYIQTIPKRGYRFVAPVTDRSEPDVREPEVLPATASAIRPGRKYALAVVTGVVLAAGGIYVAARYPKSKPLTDQDVLVLADFTNSTGDPVFDVTLRDALAYQLEQSPFLKVLDDGVMHQDLERMRRSPQEHVTNDLAREICVREAKKAILGGSIASLGKSYALDLKATNCQSGAILAREHAEAVDQEHVLSSLAKAAQGMRAKLGESLSSIKKLAPPLQDWNVTTSSLEAFQSFHEGAQLYVSGHTSEAVPVLQRATELDPNSAVAWVFLAGAYYGSGGSSEKYHEYMDKAWAVRDRVSAYERMGIHRDGESMEQAIQAAEEFARTYPRSPGPRTTLGRIHQTTGEFEKALADFQEVYRLYRESYPLVAIEVIGLIMSYGQLDRFDEAKAVAAEVIGKGHDASMLRNQLLWIAYAQGDQESAAKQVEWFSGKPDEYRVLAQQAAEARVRGQLRKSRELVRRAADLARLRNLPDAAATYLKPDPAGDALIGNCATPQSPGDLSDSSPDHVGLAALIPANHLLGSVLALCAPPSLAEQAEALNPRWVSGANVSPAKVPVTRAAIAYRLGDPSNAIELLESGREYERGYPMANYIRGLAYLKLKKGTEAAAEFQKILDHRGANWGPLYPLSYIGVARGVALAGDTAGARQAYETFFELWKDADSDVPILIQARKEYARLAQ